MKLRFWGTRGSIPVSGPQYVEFGGHTPALEITLASTPEPLILDAGTGIRNLGADLLSRPDAPRTVHLFLTHAHWDHIQGFPFFGPLMQSGFDLQIRCTKDARSVLSRQMEPPFFPLRLEDMLARLTFTQIAPESETPIAAARVLSIPLPHPQESTAFRVEEGGRAIVLATDTEHPVGGVNERLVAFAHDADLLIYDAQYTPEEYGAGRRGWGHSTFEQGIEIARRANVKRLALFSHDPTHDDAICRAIEARAHRHFHGAFAAREGMVVEL